MGCGVPISPQCRSATDKLGDIARPENWRNLGGKKGSHPFLGVSSLGHHGRVEGPLPLEGVAPQLQPLQGMLLRLSTYICLKDLTRDVREFFNSLLGQVRREL